MWLFNGEQTSRHRYEHSHLTTGMWATTAIAAGGVDSAEGFSQELLKVSQSVRDGQARMHGRNSQAASSSPAVPGLKDRYGGGWGVQFYEGGDFWGNTVDPTGFNEDIAHNELYFDQVRGQQQQQHQRHAGRGSHPAHTAPQVVLRKRQHWHPLSLALGALDRVCLLPAGE